MFDLGEQVKVPTILNRIGKPCIGQIVGMLSNGQYVVNVFHVSKRGNHEIKHLDKLEMEKMIYEWPDIGWWSTCRECNYFNPEGPMFRVCPDCGLDQREEE